MLFGGTYKTRFTNEEDNKRNLQLFMNWTPPDGFTFKHHWTLADGSGGVFVAEADSAESLLAATSPWVTRMEFDIAPVVDIAEAVPVFLQVQEWMDGVE